MDSKASADTEKSYDLKDIDQNRGIKKETKTKSKQEKEMKETQTRQEVKGKKTLNIITDASEAIESMKQEKSVTGKDILRKKKKKNSKHFPER